MAESDLGGNVSEEYIFFGGKRIARRVVSPSSVSYYVADHLGTSRVIVQANATTACYEADFTPYGKERVITNTCPQNYKFTGKERDTESTLDYFGARYYSWSFGRFHSPDLPFIDQKPTNPQSWNLYGYARNNPLVFSDPTGNEVIRGPMDNLGLLPEVYHDGPGAGDLAPMISLGLVPADLAGLLITPPFGAFSWVGSQSRQNTATSTTAQQATKQESEFPSAEDLAAGNFISVTSRPLGSHWTAHIPGHHRISIPIVVDGKVTGKYLDYEVKGDPGTTENQQVRLNEARRGESGFSGRLIRVTPEQKQALVDRLNHFVKNPNACPVCGPKYVLTKNNSNTFVYNMLSQNPAGRIAPPRPMYPSPGYRESKDKYY